jgi:hypothetical protein
VERKGMHYCPAGQKKHFSRTNKRFSRSGRRVPLHISSFAG